MHSVAWWPTLLVLVVATFTDLRSRRIPNWLVLPFLVAGVVVAGCLHGWPGLGKSLEGMGLGLLLYGVLFLMGGMGAGDVKLCAALGAWIGPRQLVVALLLTGIVGAIMALCWAAMGGFLGEMFKSTADLIFGWKKRGMRPPPELKLSSPKARKMPYAPAIALGTLLSFFSH